jgi:chromosome partitioning protein
LHFSDDFVLIKGMRKIAIINQKGGVGKTTTTVNLGCGLARAGKKVILIDLDPQAHLTMHLGIEPKTDQPNVYQVLTGSCSLEESAVKVQENLTVIPSTIDLAAAEVELSSVVGREVILRDAIEEYPHLVDVVMMDCPPSLGVLTINSLCAVNEVIITLQPHFLALQGMGKLLETINLVAKRINHHLKVTGVVLCMHEAGTKLAGEVINDMEQFFAQSRGQKSPWSGAVIFQTRIRRNIKLAEAPSYGQDIFAYAPVSNGAEDYASLTAEVIRTENETVSVSAVIAAHGEINNAPAQSDIIEPSIQNQNSCDCVPCSGSLPDAHSETNPAGCSGR